MELTKNNVGVIPFMHGAARALWVILRASCFISVMACYAIIVSGEHLPLCERYTLYFVVGLYVLIGALKAFNFYPKR